jgi:hypothetical protein
MNEYKRGPFFYNNTVYSDIIHYAGNGKPWFKPLNVSMFPRNETAIVDFWDFWVYWLWDANRTFDMQLPSYLSLDRRNPLGAKPKASDVYSAKQDLTE